MTITIMVDGRNVINFIMKEGLPQITIRTYDEDSDSAGMVSKAFKFGSLVCCMASRSITNLRNPPRMDLISTQASSTWTSSA